ncbi:MAG: SDR family oxidoreductase, partial [Acidobacteriota bacterium]
RQDVGRVLRDSGVPTVELRASIVIGSESLSFEMIRTLVNRLPVMVTPRWVRTPTQPIAIEDVVDYLVEAAEVPVSGSAVFEIGGADVVSYSDLMREYARQRGLRRLLIPVPVLSPWLSSLWLGLVSPLYARVGRKLVDSIRNETIVRDDSALQAFGVEPRGVGEAIARAMANEDRAYAETRWSDALSSAGPPPSWGGTRAGARLLDSREIRVPVAPRDAFRPIQRIGGRRGWYHADWLWRLRGFLDLLVGGVGLRRGRPHPVLLHVGDTVDWWRVERYEPDRLLRLAAEMRLPGRAWLQFEVTPDADGSRIRQTAVFDPAGLGGLVYWYAVYPVHALVFRGMLRAIAERAVAQDG